MLRANDRGRLSQALAIESVFQALAGPAAAEKAARIQAEAWALARAAGDAYAEAVCGLVSGGAAFFSLEWRKAAPAFELAESAFLENCSGVALELGTARLMGCVSPSSWAA